MKISIDPEVRTDDARRREVLASELGFGNYFADRMFTVRWDQGQGWHDAKVGPHANFSLDPAAAVFHYGQAIFEGQKAYAREDGEILLFRPEMNHQRFNRSASRLCMPEVPEDLYLSGLNALIDAERDWVPRGEMQSLYVRPFMIATEPLQGVRPANQYLFAIITSPVGAYYASGFRPVKIHVSEDFVRAAEGGTGSAKAAGNYAASLLAGQRAQEAGCQQVLWLDAAQRRFVEEIGAMNVFFVIDGKLITPPLGGSILPGVTRDTVLTLAADKGLAIEQRRIAIDEVTTAIEKGSCTEAFGCGTAAVITAISGFVHGGREFHISDEVGPVARQMFETITGIQWGRLEDPHGWVRVVPKA